MSPATGLSASSNGKSLSRSHFIYQNCSDLKILIVVGMSDCLKLCLVFEYDLFRTSDRAFYLIVFVCALF